MRVKLARGVADLGGVSVFDHAPVMEHGDAGGEIAHHGHGMRNEQVGEREFALEVAQEVGDLRGYADVERGEGLVEND